MIQDDLFAGGEGDRYFERNRASLEVFDPAADFPCRVLELGGVRAGSVLEIGAANGFRVAALAESWSAHGVALDPSAAAIDDGRARFPWLTFIVGRIDSIPLDEQFEVVIVNFVLHWVDRSNLFRAVAEIDRMVGDGGHLVIGDFFPPDRRRRRYHHALDQAVFTYKQDYASLFLSSGLYRLVTMLSSTASDDDCRATWLLEKNATGLYAER